MTASTSPEAHRRLHEAVARLCGDGTLAERLEHAHAALATLDPARELPAALQFRFEELLADITYGADTVHAAVSRMSAPDRLHLARRIVSVFDEALRMLAPDA
jgi:hypothetical protein